MLLLNTMKRYPLLEKIKYDVITTKEVKAFNFVKLTKKKTEMLPEETIHFSRTYYNVFREKSLKLSWKFNDRPKFPVRPRLELVLLPILAMKGA